MTSERMTASQSSAIEALEAELRTRFWKLFDAAQAICIRDQDTPENWAALITAVGEIPEKARRAAPRTPVLEAEPGALRQALENVLSLYTALVNSHHAGMWNPELIPEVIAARAALAAPRTPESTGEGPDRHIFGVFEKQAALAALPPSSGLQTADIAFTGPVDGMGDADPSGAYLLLHIDRKDRTQERLKVSVGAVEGIAGDLAGMIEGPALPPSSVCNGMERAAQIVQERADRALTLHKATPSEAKAAWAWNHVRDELLEVAGLIREAAEGTTTSSGWEAGAEAMREAAASKALDLWDTFEPASKLAERIRALPLPPPPSPNGEI